MELKWQLWYFQFQGQVKLFMLNKGAGEKEPPKFDRCTYGKKSKEKEEKLMVHYFTNAVKKTNSGMCVWTLSAVKFKDKYQKCMSRFGDLKSKSNGYQLLTQKHCLSKLG